MPRPDVPFAMADCDWDRLAEKLRMQDPEDPMSCWIWMGSVSSKYGQIKVQGRTRRTHRAAWIYFRGEIPTGLVLDHTCENKLCCNPWHLEPTVDEANVKRGKTYWSNRTHCPKGHPLDGQGQRPRDDGSPGARRWCKTCNREAMQERRRRLKAA